MRFITNDFHFGHGAYGCHGAHGRHDAHGKQLFSENWCARVRQSFQTEEKLFCTNRRAHPKL